jgi:di/tricarboxylate transporter
MATGVVPNVQAALIGCLMMGLFGAINLEQAYRAIQWKGLIMIVGMLPFALALDRTGGVDLAANALLGLVGDAGPYAVLALLYLVTVVLGLFIVNTANAVLLIPVALTVAEEMQASPYPFAMIIALGASSAFMTPISPINTLVTTAGNYSFGDFIRIGLPLTLIVGLVSVLLVPMLLPLW